MQVGTSVPRDRFPMTSTGTITIKDGVETTVILHLTAEQIAEIRAVLTAPPTNAHDASRRLFKVFGWYGRIRTAGCVAAGLLGYGDCCDVCEWHTETGIGDQAVAIDELVVIGPFLDPAVSREARAKIVAVFGGEIVTEFADPDDLVGVLSERIAWGSPAEVLALLAS
jgi:hypothetical protein